MSGSLPCILVTQDFGLQVHWQKALHMYSTEVVGSFADLLVRARNGAAIVWLDNALRGLPGWTDPQWQTLLQQPGLRLVATASNPNDDAAIAALDAGCAGYCHAYAQAAILQQVAQVVATGHVWIGPTLMQRLIQGANRAATIAQAKASDWRATLTPRESEVAEMAAKGASNQEIAVLCGISQRTVKAHLSAIFEKLGVVDRLQLTLKVHGIA
ncbi:MAG: response regulator transcription factor [Rhodoferax sp.]|nr:response regulator transcription factor [Rhodoferax sp.]